MTEQEIIEYLKQNREKGVAFAFMPEEVKHWCGFHSPLKIFKIYDGVWLGPWIIRSFNASNIYCLSEDYQPEPEFKPHWEEFEVDEDGCFHDDGDLPCKWYRWFDFLNVNADKYNGFGGWLYVGTDVEPTWYMTPRIDVGGKTFVWAEADLEAKPAMPMKIRFWRYAE